MNKIDALKFRTSVSELLSTKSKMTIEKRDIETRLSELRNEIRAGGVLPDNVYKSICSQQNYLKRQKDDLERKIAEINIEIRKKSDLETEIHLKSKAYSDDESTNKLLILKDKYMRFSSDSTRISSMRVMASEFVQEIDNILNGQSK